MYLNVTTGAYPVDPRRAHPNVSFPRDWLGGTVEGVTYAFVHPVDVPAPTSKQTPVKGAPTLVDGRYIETWALVDDTPEQAADKIAARWSDVRADRNARLADCDWTQLADSPLTTEQRAAWATYRQALRDVTEQQDPYALTWPSEP